MDELLDSLSKSSDTAVGPDDIHYQMLKHIPSEVLYSRLTRADAGILERGRNFPLPSPPLPYPSPSFPSLPPFPPLPLHYPFPFHPIPSPFPPLPPKK